MFDLTGKSALVTGASGGIGGAIVKALHGAGATVGLSGTREEPLNALAAELGDRGKRCIIVDQEPENFLGGQAFWSLGGLFMVDTPEQRRLKIRDSRELALSDWLGSAQFDRPEDHWPRQWAQAYIDFAAGIAVVNTGHRHPKVIEAVKAQEAAE